MYVPDLTCTAQEYTDAMTLSGTKVEGFETAGRDLDKIVIGQIEKIEPHPDADKLIICQVNVGTETIQIVTGAPNVKEGDKVPVVLDGGRVAGNHDGKNDAGRRIDQNREAARRGVLRYDVLHRGAGLFPGILSGSAGVWHLHFSGGCGGRCRAPSTRWDWMT